MTRYEVPTLKLIRASSDHSCVYVENMLEAYNGPWGVNMQAYLVQKYTQMQWLSCMVLTSRILMVRSGLKVPLYICGLDLTHVYVQP